MRATGFRVAFVGLALLYIAAVALASHAAGPRLWGFHLIGFLPPISRFVIGSAFAIALALLGVGAARAGTRSPRGRPVRLPRRWNESIRIAFAFAAISGIIYWLLRARTQFLGDGTLWLSGMQTGEQLDAHQPLAGAIWLAAARALRAANVAVTASTVAPVSILCGSLVALLIWLLARELGHRGRPFLLTLLLLSSLGTMQLFCGYIEMYAPVALVILAFVCLGLWTARAEKSPAALAFVLTIAITSHLVCAYLVPAYIFLVVKLERVAWRRAVYVLLPLALAGLLLRTLGYDLGRLETTIRIAVQGVDPHSSAAALTRDARAYGILSWDHALDMVNEFALVAPVPLLFLVSSVLSKLVSRPGEPSTGVIFLGVCALSGIVTFSVLVLPVASAQDWDLFSLLLIPFAVFAINIGLGLVTGPGCKMFASGLVLLSFTSAAAFVLVNADTAAGVARFETLVGPGARITRFGRAYADETLAYYHRHTGDRSAALRYAEATLENDRTNPRIWAMVGAVLASHGRYAEAIPYAKEAISRGDKSAGTRANLVVCYVQTGRYAEAIPYAEEAISRGDKSAGTRTNLGLCYAQTGRRTEALLQFRSAASVEPDNPDYQLNLALGYLGVNLPDSARAVLKHAMHRWPNYILAASAFRKYFGSEP